MTTAPTGRVLFLGSKRAGLRICRHLMHLNPAGVVGAVVCPNDVNDSRTEISAFQELAASAGVPFHVVKSKAETAVLVEQYSPQIVVVHGWYFMLPTEEFPSVQFFGFHYSPLPKYRGNAPLVWQIIRGETSIGVSLFQLGSGLDDGPLYDQQTASLALDDTIADAQVKADDIAEEMAGRFMSDWVSGHLRLRPQQQVEPSYCGMRTPEDGRIDWTCSGRSIHNFVRAQSRPYPGAYTRMPDGRRLTVWRAAIEPRDFIGVPGGVCEISTPTCVVAAGTGAVRLVEVQLEGHEPAAAADVLRSLRLRLG